MATTTSSKAERGASPWASKYRGATVEDLDPPPALSVTSPTPLSHALITAYERDYTHLTVLSPGDKHLLGYLNIPQIQQSLKNKLISENDAVEKAMVKFQRKGKKYRLITMETRLEELEAFFDGEGVEGERQDFAVVTDPARRFVLGVATRGDLGKFVERRPF